ncbi:MAG: pyridoxal-phosphate dependent enzyme [Thaumarchaeota archaeon]|jgi:cysteine synthase/O-phosphoserine sulfhydrylase/cystathionine beta-synthase|nr:pyridoxal-phosphate dependent enzyme [Candidatus Geocrenenecus arthurdayi]MCL7397384.1 pyridoxal-phosphate dependent enzyme [Candidatus Geocrenenecus arthurdayi]MCL7404300.1 pyridoxal-phosphate dependent enzyme [Candidatus Geocrenenecus arthurdayi]
MKLVSIEDVKSPPRPPIEELLDEAAKLLRLGRVTETILVDEEYNLCMEDYRRFHALKILGVRCIPVSVGSKEDVDLTLEDLGFDKDLEYNSLRVCRNNSELIKSCWPTPLVRLNFLSNSLRDVWAKLEYLNPFSNSIKDRIGWYMVIDAFENNPKIGTSRLIYEASSTNTGIALACIGKSFNLKIRIYLPQTVQRCSDTYIRLLGSEVVRVPEQLTIQAIDRVRQDSIRDNALHINQFENDANFISHLRFTSKELDYQLKSINLRPRRIVCALGTSGHASAISFYFKNRYQDKVEIVGVQPAKDEIIPGMRRIETGMKWIHYVKIDEVIDVTRREAIEGLAKVSSMEGLPIGLSSGAVVAGLEKLSNIDGVSILIFPDHFYKYVEVLANYQIS